MPKVDDLIVTVNIADAPSMKKFISLVNDLCIEIDEHNYLDKEGCNLKDTALFNILKNYNFKGDK